MSSSGGRDWRGFWCARCMMKHLYCMRRARWARALYREEVDMEMFTGRTVLQRTSSRKSEDLQRSCRGNRAWSEEKSQSGLGTVSPGFGTGWHPFAAGSSSNLWTRSVITLGSRLPITSHGRARLSLFSGPPPSSDSSSSFTDLSTVSKVLHWTGTIVKLSISSDRSKMFRVGWGMG